jgi:hypothetical protein
MAAQGEFLLADGVRPELHLAHPLDAMFQEIAAVWGLPVGRRVRLSVRDPALPELSGRLELIAAPDLPFNPREALRLRVSGVAFSSAEIAEWVLSE